MPTEISALELSAETARLSTVHNPRGKPGGPGLYGVKGNQHSAYLQNIVKALIRSGHPPGQAYAIAYGALRRWRNGKGKVHPEVRAAAAKALGEEKAAAARAKGYTAPSISALELSGTSAGAAKHQRGAAGTSQGGQFVSPNTQQAQARQQAKNNAANAAAGQKSRTVAALRQQLSQLNAKIVQYNGAIKQDATGLQALLKQQSAATSKRATSTSAKAGTATAAKTSAAPAGQAKNANASAGAGGAAKKSSSGLSLSQKITNARDKLASDRNALAAAQAQKSQVLASLTKLGA